MVKTILTLAANPDGTSNLKLDLEIRNIQEELERAKYREEFKFERRDAVRWQDLLHAILEVEPRIIHFSGHGTGSQGLIILDDNGHKHLVSTEVLSDLFRQFSGQVECVLLNACYSEAQARAIVQHINYVIGMSEEIRDDAAIAFTKGFYAALGAGKAIAQAFEIGRSSVLEKENSPLAGQDRKLVPVNSVDIAKQAQASQYSIPTLLIKEELTPFAKKSTGISQEAILGQTVGKGLEALTQLMAESVVRNTAIAFRTDFQATSAQIEILGNYKDLHDLLHTLEIQCYRGIIQEARGFPDDETSLEVLTQHELTIQDLICGVQGVADRGIPPTHEILWLKDLREGQEALHRAIEELDTRQLQRTIWLLNRVLAIQPSRLNSSLNESARTLRLPALVCALNSLWGSIANSKLDRESLNQFREGVESLDKLNVDFAALVKAHDAWQEVDLELRRIEPNLERDTFELEMSWPDLRGKMEALCGDSPEQWSLDIRQSSQNLDKALTDKTPVKIKRSFNAYRRLAINRFFQVDLRLKRLCDELRVVAKPLDFVLRMIG